MFPRVTLNKYLKSLIFYPFFFSASECVSFLKRGKIKADTLFHKRHAFIF